MSRPGQILKRLFFEFDTVTIRLMMACASLIFAGALWASPEPFARDAYNIMEWVAPQWVWALAHVLYGSGTIFLIAASHEKRLWNFRFRAFGKPRDLTLDAEHFAFGFNAFGFLIWSFYTASVSIAVGYFAPSTALELMGSLLLFWSLIRTGYGRKVRHG